MSPTNPGSAGPAATSMTRQRAIRMRASRPAPDGPTFPTTGFVRYAPPPRAILIWSRCRRKIMHTSSIPVARGGMRYPLALSALIGVLAGITVADRVVHAEESSVAQGNNDQKSKRVEPMPEQRFWALIGTTTAIESDPERQGTPLLTPLRKLSIDETEEYEATCASTMHGSYAGVLW